MGALFEVYPKYIRKEDLLTQLSEFEDLNRELAYLLEKKLVNKKGVPSLTKGKRTLEILSSMGSVDSDPYLSVGYEISVSGIDALREDFTDPTITSKSRQKPKPAPIESIPTSCQHRKIKLIEVKEKSKLNLKAGIASTGAEREKTDYVGIYQCSECKDLFWKDVKAFNSRARGELKCWVG
ncbi:MAG: hypothetical protein ABSE82_06735 [Nitrososphaerales archaeon]